VAEDLRRAYKQRFEEELEPERYEIFDLLDSLTPDRREFLKVLGGGLFFLVTVRAQGQDVPVRVQVAEDGTFRAFTGKMEMGQGSRTLLTQAFAEELRVPIGSVDLVMGDTLLCPDDGGTWSSLTSPQTVPVIRQAAAAVRAARSGGSDALTSPAGWKVLGTSVRSVNSLAIVTGVKAYPTDFAIPGMQHAVIVRNPHHRGSLVSFDATAAELMAGARVLREGDLLAVVAADPATARRAAARITAEWKPGTLTPQADWPTLFRKTAIEPVEQPRARYPPLLRRGDVAAGLGASTKTRSSTYWVPPIAHVPLEPRAAVAEWQGDIVTIRCGVQAPFLVRQEVAQALKVPQTQVRIIAMDSGGAFGGKQRGECEVEAARLARLAGTPVRVAWTREEEFTCSYTRPAGLLEIESGVDASGRLIAMRFANYNSGAAGITPPYDIANHWVGYYRTTADVRQGSYRSLAAVANNFARESHMDEWATDLRIDPVEFRLRNTTDARLREVIEATAARFGWGRTRSGSGRGFGMSCNLEKDARLALCVEVETDGSDVRVVRMAATGDFGAALNPDNLRNQMTGALIQGIGGALWEQVAFDTTRQTTRRLSGYRVPRFSDLPRMDVDLIDRRDLPPAGAGESPITLTAPAIAAAVFAATGVRRRDLPLIAGGRV
jgi:CO/xanthine dehydrogenase Mo-binding subunit